MSGTPLPRGMHILRLSINIQKSILHNTGRLQNESKTFPRIFLFYQRISTEYGSISSRISQNSNPHKLLMKLAGAQLKDDVDSQTSLYPHPLAL